MFLLFVVEHKTYKQSMISFMDKGKTKKKEKWFISGKSESRWIERYGMLFDKKYKGNAKWSTHRCKQNRSENKEREKIPLLSWT